MINKLLIHFKNSDILINLLKDKFKFNDTDIINILTNKYQEYYKELSERKYIIYKYTFSDNKVYIGKTYTSSSRLGNISKYRGQNVYQAMILNPNFIIDILEECSLDKVDELESYYINKYNSTDSNYGYNISPGYDCTVDHQILLKVYNYIYTLLENDINKQNKKPESNSNIKKVRILKG